MSGPPIAPVPRADWPALAGFVLEANRRPDGRVRCLHCDHGDDAAKLAAEMLALPEDEALYLAARDAQGWRGMIGAEWDLGLGRAWLRGPLVDTALPPAEATALVRALIAALWQALPPALVRLDAFPQADEALLCDAYLAAGFEDRLVNHVLHAGAPGTPPAWPAGVVDTRDDPESARAAAALHRQAFPEGYLTPDTLLSTRDDAHRLFAALDQGTVQGYLYLQHDAELGEGYIDYVAVSPQAQGRGLGRALIDAALHWCFAERGLPRVALTVRGDRTPALALYRSAGFAEVAAGRHLCGLRPRPAGTD